MNLRHLDDDALLENLVKLVRQEREDTAEIVAHLAEMDSRKLAEERGYPSLFVYCVKVLGYCEPSAYHRIRAARAVKKKPELLELLRCGKLHLRSLVLLHPHLESENAQQLVEQAVGKSKREVEALIAPLSPQPRSRDTVRLVTVKVQPSENMPLFEPATVSPWLPAAFEARAHVSFFADPGLVELLQRAKEVLRHKYPQGRLEDVFKEALKALLERKDPDFWAQPKRDKESATRKISRWVRHQVWKRDQGRCVYEAPDGRRCRSRDGIEFDHVIPWALGGSSNDPKNIRLLCRAHNQHLARRAGLIMVNGTPK